MFYIEYKDINSGQTYTKYFNYKPNATNAYCPYCGNQVMDRQVIVEPIVETRVYYECLHCGKSYEQDDKEFVKVNSVYLDPIVYLEVHETEHGEVKAHTTYITNNNISDTVHKFQDIDNAVINKYPIPTNEPVQLFTALDRIDDLAQDINVFTFKPLIDALTEFPLLFTTVDIDSATAVKIKGRLLDLYSKIDVGQTKWKRQSDRDYHEGYFDAIFNIIALMLA